VTDIDLALARLGQVPVPVELAAIDDAVLTGVARRQREAAVAPRLMGVAGALALGLGIAGGSLSSSDPASAQSLSPFAPANVLAPSTLLDLRP
jgi:hypothetical protein